MKANNSQWCTEKQQYGQRWSVPLEMFEGEARRDRDVAHAVDVGGTGPVASGEHAHCELHHSPIVLWNTSRAYKPLYSYNRTSDAASISIHELDTIFVHRYLMYSCKRDAYAYIAFGELGAELLVERVGHLHVLEHALELRRELAAALGLREQ